MMSHRLALDGRHARWLAELDPALALLPEALPPPSLGTAWRLHDVRWDPGRGCRLAYRVGSRRSPPTFVAVDVTGSGWHRKDYRDDRHLPGLSRATDPGWAASRLTPLLAEPILAFGVEPVRYRPGSHCVVRYAVRTASGSSTVYGKLFGDRGFGDVVARTTSLARASGGARLVPENLTSWPDVNATVVGGVAGRSASAIIADHSVTAGDRARVAYQLGGLLADFHGIREVEAPTWSSSDQIASVAQSLDAMCSADGFLGERVRSILEELAGNPPASTGEVLGHGGFRAGQVIVSEHALVVLDTDGLCRCDPGRDLGTALAHLRWQAVRHPGEQQALLDAERALLAGYEARTGAMAPDVLAWWRAVGLLQVGVRRYRRLELADWSSVPLLVDAAADLLAGRQAPRTRSGATDLLDPQQMTAVLQLGLETATSPRALEVQSAEAVATVPGRRAVVRYRIRGLAGERSVTVMGKTFAESWRAQLLHEHLRLLHEGPFGDGELRVPEPVALLPEQRLVLYRQAPGTPLDRITDPMRIQDGVHRAALWLARLHTSPVRFRRQLSQAVEEDATRQWAAAVGRSYPHLAAPARRLADSWAAAAPTVSSSIRAPIHKDFHAGHVLIDENTFVVDLDEARQGDPAFDVAHFCTYLALFPGGADGHRLSHAFLDDYAAATGWRDRGSFGPFLAYTWLKIAKQWAVGSGPGRDVPPARRAVRAEDALAQGWLCLTG